MFDAGGENLSAECSSELVARAQAGGSEAEAAREQIARSYRPLVLSIVASVARDRNAREDVVQAAYLGLLTALDRFDSARGISFATFARKHVVGSALRVVRRECDLPSHLGEMPVAYSGPLAESLDPATPSDTLLELDEAARDVRAFVSNLPPRLRLLAQRVFWEDALQADVARELGVSRMMISKLMTEIRRRGRQELAVHGDDRIAA